MRHTYGKYAVLALSLWLLLNVATATTGPADRYINSSEPAFLHDIGPQDQRTDNPLAAAVTTLAVAAIFYRGFRRYHPENDDDDDS